MFVLMGGGGGDDERSFKRMTDSGGCDGGGDGMGACFDDAFDVNI
jgi:hypothetical protein